MTQCHIIEEWNAQYAEQEWRAISTAFIYKYHGKYVKWHLVIEFTIVKTAYTAVGARVAKLV